MTHRVVVLGGGPGGLVAANTLAAAAVEDLEVVLVDRSGEQLFQPGLVAVLFGDAEVADHRRALAELVRPGVRLVVGEVDHIDPDTRSVSGSFGRLEYDELVLALGADVDVSTSAVGAELAPWTADGALAGRLVLASSGPGSRIVVGAAGLPYRCPPAVFDLAIRIKGATGADVEIVHPWPRPLAPFGEHASRRFQALLENAGVRFTGGFRLASVTDGRLTSVDGREVEADAAFLVPPHVSPPVVATSALAGRGGWPAVSYPTLTHPSYPEVSVIGDLTAVPLATGMAGTLAVAEGRFVAQRILAALTGAPAPAEPDMAALCFVDTGATGSALACDFTDAASGNGAASCVLLPPLPYYRKAKRLFAEEWFADTVR